MRNGSIVNRLHGHTVLRLIIGISLVLSFGCGNGKSEIATGDGGAPVANAPAIPRAPVILNRIVSLSPNLTEMMYAIGAGDKVVGVTPYCKFPPEAAQKPKVGALMNVDYELLKSLKPDGVLLLPGQKKVALDLKAMGIPTALFRTERIGDIFLAMRKLGEITGKSSEAETAIAEIQSKFDAVKKRGEVITAVRQAEARTTATLKPIRAMFVIGRNPGTLQQMYVAGSGNYIDEIMHAIGWSNAMETTVVPWPVLNKEKLVYLDPDIILDGSIRAGEAPISGDEHMKAWDEMYIIGAVKRKKVYAVNDEQLLLVGPGFADGAMRLINLVHGDVPTTVTLPVATPTETPQPEATPKSSKKPKSAKKSKSSK